MIEDQTTEFKETWRDEYLKTVCAFANTEGGIIYVGIDDKGNDLGILNANKLLEDFQFLLFAFMQGVLKLCLIK